GELLMRVILRRNLGENAPEVKLAERWAGDQMVILQSGSDISVIWLIAFTDSAAAAQFAGAYAGVLNKLNVGTPREIDTKDNAVMVLIGTPAQAMEGLGPALWKASIIGDQPQQPSAK